jgi:hypothetical protein
MIASVVLGHFYVWVVAVAGTEMCIRTLALAVVIVQAMIMAGTSHLTLRCW